MPHTAVQWNVLTLGRLNPHWGEWEEVAMGGGKSLRLSGGPHTEAAREQMRSSPHYETRLWNPDNSKWPRMSTHKNLDSTS